MIIAIFKCYTGGNSLENFFNNNDLNALWSGVLSMNSIWLQKSYYSPTKSKLDFFSIQISDYSTVFEY